MIYMRVLFFLLLYISILTGQTNDREIRMHVKIGTLSEILIPEPYTIIQTPVQIVEMRDVDGRNKQVVTLHPIISQKAQTNLRIYTQNYDFDINLMLNWPNARATKTLDLRRYIPAEKLAEMKKSKERPKGDTKPSQHIIDGVETDEPVTKADFDIRKLLNFYPRLLKSNKHAPAMLKNRVVFAMDHVFHYRGKLVFKATLWNKSKVPYNILHFTITYKERVGVPLINRREAKSLTLAPFYEIYSRKLVPPGKKSHIIYVTSKLSPQDKGSFNCLLVERQGTRNFDFDIPAYIK